MKIQLLHSNVDVAILGVPPVETFDLTPRSLAAWNHHHSAPLGSGRGISANENWNREQGLPCPAGRRWLSRLHSSLHGICGPNRLTWAEVRAAIS